MSFKTDLAWGQFKEKVVMKVLEIGYCIQSVHDNAHHGHDIKLNNGKFIEVKADSNFLRSKKIYLEIFSNWETKRKGWLQYSDAHILAYCPIDWSKAGNTPYVIFFDFLQLREFVKRTYFKGSYDLIDDFTETYHYGKQLSILVPLNEVEKYVICKYSKDDREEIYRKESLLELCS